MIADGYRFPFREIKCFGNRQWLYNIVNALNVIFSFRCGIVHLKMIDFMLYDFNSTKKSKMK